MFNVLIKLRLLEVNPAKLVKNLNEKSGEREVYLSHKDFSRLFSNCPFGNVLSSKPCITRACEEAKH